MSEIVHEINRGNQHSNRIFPILKTPIRNKHPRDYRLIDDIVGSVKTFKFISAKVCQVNRGNHQLNKQKNSYFDDVFTQKVSA